MIRRIAVVLTLLATQAFAQQIRQETPRPQEQTANPALSLDGTHRASIRSQREVWVETPENPQPRKLFECPAPCRGPQFTPDNRSLFVVVDTSPTTGGLWKIDVAGGSGAQFIPNAATFRVVQIGPYAGFVIADQPTLTESDGTPYDRPYYVFFIFRPSGSRIGRISRGVDDDVEVLLMEYSQ